MIAAGVGDDSEAASQGGGSGQDGGPDITDRIPMGRLGDPDEIGCAALSLCSGLASYMTGSQVVDGGLLLS